MGSKVSICSSQRRPSNTESNLDSEFNFPEDSGSASKNTGKFCFLFLIIKEFQNISLLDKFLLNMKYLSEI